MSAVLRRGWRQPARRFATASVAACPSARSGIVLGVSTDGEAGTDARPVHRSQLTEAAGHVDKATGGELVALLNRTAPMRKVGSVRLVQPGNGNGEYGTVAAVALGDRRAHASPADEHERLHVGKENVRTAVGAGVALLKRCGLTHIEVDPCAHAQAASEAAHLVDYDYDELKAKKRTPLALKLFQHGDSEGTGASGRQRQWRTGAAFGRAQNVARRLSDAPANVMTPDEFAQRCAVALPDGIVTVRGREWLEEKKMGAFLSVARGSCLEPKLVEIRLNATDQCDDQRPIVLVGKGVTYDTGGIMLKPAKDLGEMHADMLGAASVFATAYGLHQLGVTLKRPLVVLCALAENCIGPSATRPGDVVRASDGRTIKVDNTDAEGRLCMADALVYANAMRPHSVLTVATLTGLIRLTLGHTSAVWCSDEALYGQLRAAGAQSADRVWRMPLWRCYDEQLRSDVADISNYGTDLAAVGRPCAAARFLQSFAQCDRFAHLDIAGVMRADPECTYLGGGMSGRPTRLLLQWLHDSIVSPRSI